MAAIVSPSRTPPLCRFSPPSVSSMRQTFRRFWQWFCAPDDIKFSTAFYLYCVSYLLGAFLVVFYYGVMMDNVVLKENPMHQLIADMDSFVQDIEGNVSGHQLLKDHPWLHNSEVLLTESCFVVPKNLKYLRYMGFVFAGYNTLLLHLLLSGTVPISVVAYVPIITSCIAGLIDPAQIVRLGLFEFTQLIISSVIFGTFVIQKDHMHLFVTRDGTNRAA
jgi:hypothetical protein